VEADDAKKLGIAGVVVVALAGIITAAIQFRPWESRISPPEGGPSLTPASQAPRTETEAVKDIVRKTQILEFLTVYTNPRSFDSQKLLKTLEPYYVPSTEGGSAAANVIEQTQKLRQSGRHYSKDESRLISMEFDQPAFSGTDVVTVTTRELWFLPFYERNKKLPRKPEVSSRVTYRLRKIEGHWKLESTTNLYHR
jgi:hypothetical protein